MDEYTRKYGQTRATSKPECYGDVDYYDHEDPTCRECPVRSACRIIVDRKVNSSVREATSRPTSTTSYRDRLQRPGHMPRRDVERAPLGDADSFWGALMFNGFLSATKSVLQEAHHGVDSIPYMRYPDPFRRPPKT